MNLATNLLTLERNLEKSFVKSTVTYEVSFYHLVGLECLKFEAVLDGTAGLFDCQQLFCNVNPSTERENPLAGIFENSFPPLLYLRRNARLF